MKATVSKHDLMAALTKVAAALPTRSTSIHALQNILMEFREGEGAIRVSATDLEVCCIADSPATVQSEGSLAVIGGKLIETIRELPDAEITLSSTEKNVLNIKSGKTRFNLRGISREEYPSLPALSGDKSFDVQASSLKETIRKVIIAASTNEARSFLNGSFITVVEKKIRFVSTDGHRLAFCDIAASGLTKSAGALSVIIPARILSIVAGAISADEKIKVSLSDTHVVFSGDIGTFSSRLIVEKFPDYQKIIPKGSDIKIAAARQTFSDSLRMASHYSNAVSSSINLSVKGNRMVITAETPEFGDAHIELDVTATGPAIEVNFNSRYLQDLLKVMTADEINIAMSSKIAPAVFTSEKDKDYVYILMPLRG